MALKVRCKQCGQAIGTSKVFRHGLNYFCSYSCFAASRNEVLESPEEDQSFDFKRFLPKSEDRDIGESRVYKPRRKVKEQDEDYLNLIRSLPCCACGKYGCHPHHMEVGGMGTKGSDYSAIPLCPEHHTMGDKAIHRIGPLGFFLEFQLNFEEVKAECLTKYIRILKCNTK